MKRFSQPAFHLLTPPYRRLHPLEAPGDLMGDGRLWKGMAMVWNLARGRPSRDFEYARGRPPGVALLVILPTATRLRQDPDLFRVVESCRPHSILPFQEEIDPSETKALLRRPPSDLPAQFTDYLTWRGIRVDMDTRRILRRTMELAEEVSTISALSRRLYISRRALGRRLVTRNLPVASHCLHFCRVLRASVLLQNQEERVASVAQTLGYPDGFALSNQMYRLTGMRPSTVRQHLGWEWLVEAWLRKEASHGRLEVPVLVPTGLKADTETPLVDEMARASGDPRATRNDWPEHAKKVSEPKNGGNSAEGARNK